MNDPQLSSHEVAARLAISTSLAACGADAEGLARALVERFTAEMATPAADAPEHLAAPLEGGAR